MLTKIKAIFQVSVLNNQMSFGLFCLRVIAGLAFMYHGWGKIQSPMSWMPPEAPIPGFFQLLAAVSEFGGGLAWIIGLLTPLASFGMACTMAVATAMHAIVLGDPFVSSGGGKSYELALLYLVISILLILTGPGKFSLDKMIFGNKN